MSHVSLGITKPNKTNPYGCFVGNFFTDGKYKESKTISLGRGVDIAYQTVDLWSEDKAKEHDVEYRKVTMKELLAKLKEEPKTRTEKNGRQLDLLNNKTQFRVQIKQAFENHSATRIREVIQDGLSLLNIIEKEKEKIVKNTSKAKSNIAQSMYQTFIDTGVDTSQYCSDDEINNEFNKLRNELPLD